MSLFLKTILASMLLVGACKERSTNQQPSKTAAQAQLDQLQDLAKFYLYANNNSQERVFLGASQVPETIPLAQCSYKLTMEDGKPAYRYEKCKFKGYLPYQGTDSVLIMSFDLYYQGKFVNAGAHDYKYHNSISIDTFTQRAVGFDEHTICHGLLKYDAFQAARSKFDFDSLHYNHWVGEYLRKHQGFAENAELYPAKLVTKEYRTLYDLAKMEAYLRYFDSRINLKNPKDPTSTTHYLGELDFGSIDRDLNFKNSGDTIIFQFYYSLRGARIEDGKPPLEIQLNRKNCIILGKRNSQKRLQNFKDFCHFVGNSWLHFRMEPYR